MLNETNKYLSGTKEWQQVDGCVLSLVPEQIERASEMNTIYPELMKDTALETTCSQEGQRTSGER